MIKYVLNFHVSIFNVIYSFIDFFSLHRLFSYRIIVRFFFLFHFLSLSDFQYIFSTRILEFFRVPLRFFHIPKKKNVLNFQFNIVNFSINDFFNFQPILMRFLAFFAIFFALNVDFFSFLKSFRLQCFESNFCY